MHENIEQKDVMPLLDQLAIVVNKKRAVIVDEALSSTKNKQESRMIEISPEFLFVCRKGKITESSLNVGFPFPIASASYKYGNNLPKNIAIESYIRGERIRKKQRNMLHNVLRMPRPIEIQDAHVFNSITKKLFKKCKNIVYVDPYAFIGDSIIGLYFLDQFISRFGARNVKVFSKAYKHLSFFYKTFPDSIELVERAITQDTIALLPDLIDNQWGKRLDLIEAISRRHGAAFIIGRNMILKFGKNPVSLHLKGEDPLLRNKNIEDYMNDCSEAYIPKRDIKITYPNPVKISKTVSIFFNGLSSFAGKDIGPKLSLEICKKLADVMGTNCYVSMGVRSSEKDSSFVSDFNEMLQKSDINYRTKIKFMDDNGLTDLARKLKKFHVGLIITADTSIAHLSNRVGLPNITIFKQNFWDSSSTQSLASSSPLGFCRYGPFEYPYILHENDSAHDVSSLVLDGSKSLLKKFSRTGRRKIPSNMKNFITQIHKLESAVRYGRNLPDIGKIHDKLNTMFEQLSIANADSDLGWLFKFYDPDQLVRRVLDNFPSKQTSSLVCTSWLLSPAYKYTL